MLYHRNEFVSSATIVISTIHPCI